jgi:hypothetical protein
MEFESCYASSSNIMNIIYLHYSIQCPTFSSGANQYSHFFSSLLLTVSNHLNFTISLDSSILLKAKSICSIHQIQVDTHHVKQPSPHASFQLCPLYPENNKTTRGIIHLLSRALDRGLLANDEEWMRCAAVPPLLLAFLPSGAVSRHPSVVQNRSLWSQHCRKYSTNFYHQVEFYKYIGVCPNAYIPGI